MSCTLKGEKERFALALLAESCEQDTYLEEYRHNQIVLSVSIEPMSETPVYRSQRNEERSCGFNPVQTLDSRAKHHENMRFIPGKRKEETMTVEENKNNDEAAIKRVIEGYVEAFRAKDLDGVMTIYAPEIVTFDVVPPLHYVGADAMRKRWEEVFSSLPGPVGYEIADLSITVGEEMAFTHSFNRTSATLPTGQQIGTWVRWTAIFRKIGGQWLLVHDQVSVPVDLQTGKAVLDLKP